MNKKLTTAVGLVLLCSRFFCQAQMVDITTPNGSPLWVFKEMEFLTDNDKAYLDSLYIADFPNAQILYPSNSTYSSTSTYNCHGYAWIGNQSGEYYFLANPNVFWDDYSYLESTEDDYDIIYYDGGEEDHSVIKSIYTQGKYISKWGGWAFNGT